MKLIVKDGTTSLSVDIMLRDNASTTADGKTGLVFNTSGLTAYGKLAGGSAAAITLATLAAANSAYSSGGFKEIDATNMKGLYRFDIPNTYLTGAKSSTIVIQQAGIVSYVIEIQMISVDLYDAVRFGLTALPNAAAEAAGGLFTRGSGAGQINQDANGRVDINAIAWKGTTLKTPLTNGVPLVDTQQITTQFTAAAGASGSVTLPGGGSATDSLYVPCMVTIISGTGAGQGPRLGITYNGSTKVLGVVPNWTTNPSTDSVIQLSGAAACVEAWLRAAPSALSSGKVQTDANLITWLGTAPLALVSQLVQTSVGAMQAGTVTASAVATDAIDADALATDALAEMTAAIKAMVVETTGPYTLGQVMSLALAVLAGRTTNSGNTFNTPDNSAARVTATTDANNNRTVITLNPST
jgi:hypothetical protein